MDPTAMYVLSTLGLCKNDDDERLSNYFFYSSFKFINFFLQS